MTQKSSHGLTEPNKNLPLQSIGNQIVRSDFWRCLTRRIVRFVFRISVANKMVALAKELKRDGNFLNLRYYLTFSMISLLIIFHTTRLASSVSLNALLNSREKIHLRNGHLFKEL